MLHTRLATQCLQAPRRLYSNRRRTPNFRVSHFSSQPQRLLILNKPNLEPRNPTDPIELHRLEAEHRAYYTRRTYWAAAGTVACMIATFVLVSTIELPPQPEKSDEPPRNIKRGGPAVGGVIGGAEVLEEGEGVPQKTEGQAEQVSTGTSTVPYFPKVIKLPGTKSSTSSALPAGTGDANEEFHLLGLGIRTVSFLSIQVYVVGLYVAASDVTVLQECLIKAAGSVDSASTLVAGEKDNLRRKLFDAEESAKVWDAVLKDGRIRSVLRIVPTRNTDFSHLRDGWVRGITARSQGRGAGQGIAESYDDERFGLAVGQFKSLFGGAGRKNIAKGKVLMLERENSGTLGAWIEGEGVAVFSKMGEVHDERISRLVWLGYLAGKSVASEGARKSVVEGVMDLVERPIGTVETQVI